MTNYVNKPKIKITSDDKITSGYHAILDHLKSTKKNKVIECYPGTDIDQLRSLLLDGLKDEYKLIYIDDYADDVQKIQSFIERNITEDRVFGFMSNHTIDEFYPQENLENLKAELKNSNYIIYGFGASQLLAENDELYYANLARWEIQARLRMGQSNWKANNADEDAIRKFKRGYFFEWRVADRLKKKYYQRFDYILDLNSLESPKLLDAKDYRLAIEKSVESPFRLVPFFDPGVWGGQWMKEKCDLDKSEVNYAWSFDGVPEENSVHFQFGDGYIEIPAIDIVFFQPRKLLGDRVHARFGDEFPIRFDFLDTIGGQNLSLQVHPLTEYIQEKFGMNYTQDESYYILDVKEDAETFIYLGTKKDIDPENFIEELKESQATGKSFDADKYVNKIPCKKHDHFLIPAGTIHCSGADTMVLEISATPYIFTFKLWDWDRLGMDGKPRPIHIEHGEKVIDFTRDSDFVYKELVNHFEKISEVEERTGLHEREFIETRRFFSTEPITHKHNGSVNMLNLVEGTAAIISSPTKQFEDYEVHYAETFIIPANIKEYTIQPVQQNEKIGYVKAYVRG